MSIGINKDYRESLAKETELQIILTFGILSKTMPADSQG